jgi:hypothetical protein
MTSEKSFENKVKTFLGEQGCWFVKYWGGGAFTKAGIPDLLICCNGYFIGAELKAEHGRPSALQIWNINEINKSGGFGMILYPDDFERFKDFIRALNGGISYEVAKEKFTWQIS